MDYIIFALGFVLAVFSLVLTAWMLKRKLAHPIWVMCIGFLFSAIIFGISVPKFTRLLVQWGNKKLELSALDQELLTKNSALAALEISVAERQPASISESNDRVYVPGSLVNKVFPTLNLDDHLKFNRKNWLVIQKKLLTQSPPSEQLVSVFHPDTGQLAPFPLDEEKTKQVEEDLEARKNEISNIEKLLDSKVGEK